MQVWVGLGQLMDAEADVVKPAAEVLAAVRRDQHEGPRLDVEADLRTQAGAQLRDLLGAAFQRADGEPQCVDHCIAGHSDDGLWHALG